MARTKLTLQDVARTASARNGGKGGRALQRIAKSKGLTLSYATVDRIIAGKYESTPQRQTIEALAVLAEMPLEQVYEAAGLPLPMSPLAEQLPDGSDQLTVHQRRVVLDVIRGFVRDNARMAELEDDLHRRPLHPSEMLRRLNEGRVEDLGEDALEELLDQLALLIPDEHSTEVFISSEARAREELERRSGAEAASGRAVAYPAQPDGITSAADSRESDTSRGMPDAGQVVEDLDRADTNDRPWEQDEYGLAAKRGRNRGREAREQQDREAEDGGA